MSWQRGHLRSPFAELGDVWFTSGQARMDVAARLRDDRAYYNGLGGEIVLWCKPADAARPGWSIDQATVTIGASRAHMLFSYRS
jgi:hypothetical protein